jgi:hypothetical protein
MSDNDDDSIEDIETSYIPSNIFKNAINKIKSRELEEQKKEAKARKSTAKKKATTKP